jgi:molybdopterin synthase sulfur carrier subunit
MPENRPFTHNFQDRKITMSNVRIPPVMRPQVGGSRDVQAGGQTVGEVLHNLTDRYPTLKAQLFDGNELQRYVNIYLNDQDIQYLQRLETPVGDSDTIIILPAMAGGCDLPGFPHDR